MQAARIFKSFGAVPASHEVSSPGYSSIPNLRFALQLEQGYCYTNNPPTTLASVGDDIESVVVAAGTGPNAIWQNWRPTLRADGLDVAWNAQSSYIEFEQDIVLTTNRTLYVTGYIPPDGSGIWILGHAGVTSTLLASFYGQILFQDAVGAGGSGSNLVGNVLVRLGLDALGVAHLAWSGDGTDNVIPNSPWVFDSIGAAPSQGVYTEGADVRYRLFLVVNEYLEYNSPGDMFVRSIIQANDGAQIIPPV